MYEISFNDAISALVPEGLNLDSTHEGENRYGGYSVENLAPDLDYVWPVYQLPSGKTVVGAKETMTHGSHPESLSIMFPDGLLTENGRLKVQIVGTDSSDNLLDILDAYTQDPPFSGKICKSDVYEFYVMDSLDPMEELVGPGGISQAAKEYLTDLVDELIAEGIHIDTALDGTSPNAVENRVVTAAINGKADKNNTILTGSLSMGRAANTTVGSSSSAVGVGLTASGTASHAEGNNNVAEGTSAHVEGNGNSVQGTSAHAEGTENTVASAIAAHAEGYDNSISSGSNAAHAEGSHNEVSGLAAHVEGTGNSAGGDESHAEGKGTISSSNTQHVQGRYNVEDSNGTYAHILGNGYIDQNDNEVRSNAHTIDWDGNAWFAGTVKVGGTSYSDSNVKELATKEYVDNKSPFVDVHIIFSDTPQSGTFSGSMSGAALSLAISDGKVPLFSLSYDIAPSDPSEPHIRVRRYCPVLHYSRTDRIAYVLYVYNGTQYIVSITWTESSSDQYTLTFNSIPTTSDMNAAIQNAIGTAIGGSY